MTVSREPAPLGPSIWRVDSVRRSGCESRGGEAECRSQGMGVSWAPLKSSGVVVVVGSLFSVGMVEVGGVVVPFRKVVVRKVEDRGAAAVGRGKSVRGLETEMTRSRARR